MSADQQHSDKKHYPKPGILRLDINKPRRSSGGSVEFRMQPELLGGEVILFYLYIYYNFCYHITHVMHTHTHTHD